jgi:hypothetical protein
MYGLKLDEKEATWFDGGSKEKLISKWATNETSFKTVGYEKTFSTELPKKLHPQLLSNKTAYNILTCQEPGQDSSIERE